MGANTFQMMKQLHTVRRNLFYTANMSDKDFVTEIKKHLNS